ncbi:MAG: bifunctional glutamate N-acetyltransferase/amino-acid acetyltransferase ArgJ [Candidatus Dormibacteria bacterium]
MSTGVTAAQGWRAAGIHCGIKRSAPDLALLHSVLPCTAAGVFTRNTVKAAPLVITQLNLRQSAPSAVVINSGNANACTGSQGLKDALLMTKLAADELDLGPAQVLVCSTGVIGRPMPMDRLREGIPAAAAQLSTDGGEAAARAIMTTDTRLKFGEATFDAGGRTCTLGVMAKGSGMIHPNMATMLAFLTTDAAIEQEYLGAALRRAADDTFNLLSVDGDTSTNDMALVMANGMAGNQPIDSDATGSGFEAALRRLCDDMSREIARDGEGATKVITVVVSGARDAADARLGARAVVASNLVKAAIHGGDPNWGRIVSALGNSGAAMILDRVTLRIGGVPIFSGGSGLAADLDSLRRHFEGDEVMIEADLGLGDGRARAYGCDLSEGYVHINASYTT